MNDPTTLINIYKDQTALIYTLWSVFQGLSLAIIGFVFSQEYVRKNPVLLACLSGSILAFSFGNHAAIMRAQSLVTAAVGQLHWLEKSCPDLNRVLCVFQAPDTDLLSWSHIAFSVCAAIGVWVPLLAALVSERFDWGGSNAAKKP